MAITRCGNFYGGGDLNWNRIVPGTIRSILRGERPVIRSDGKFIRDYFYVEDGAAAYMLLAERLACGPEAARRRRSTSPTKSRSRRSNWCERILCADGLHARAGRAQPGVQRNPPPVPERRTRPQLLDWTPLFTLDKGSNSTIAWYREFLRDAASQADELRAQILELVGEYYAEAFPPGTSSRANRPVPVSGRVFDARRNAAAGGFLARFLAHHRPLRRPVREANSRKWFGIRECRAGQLRLLGQPAGPHRADLAQAGRSALQPGDEVITVAAGFPTTVNPIIQNNLVPVFVDVTLPTYNIDVRSSKQALSPRTRAVIIAHTLGNPFDLDAVKAFAARTTSG